MRRREGNVLELIAAPLLLGLVYVTWFTPLHFYLYAVVGITTCVVVG